MAGDDGGELFRRQVERNGPVGAFADCLAAETDLGIAGACSNRFGRRGEVQGGALCNLHSRPKLAGWSGSPRTPAMRPASVFIRTPQPTPQ